MPTNKKTSTTKSKQTVRGSKKSNSTKKVDLGTHKKLIILAFIFVFAAVGSYFVFFSKAASPALTWAPPAGYETYPVKNVAVSSKMQTVNGGGGDMRIKMPNSPTGPIDITNCRNVVLIGGQINIPAGTGPASPDARGIYVKGCTGVVHIEGVYINGDIATAEGDGIAISAPQAIVQLQNLRIDKLYGGYETSSHNHSDIVQPWGGVKELRIDRLTGSSNYQGFQINEDSGPIGSEIIKNVNIGDSGVPPVSSKGGYYVWLKCGTGTKYNFSNVYVQPRSGRTLSNSVTEGGCGGQVNGGTMTFSGSSATGSLISGKPSTGDFVPAGLAGIGYVTPGYGVSTSSSGTTTPTPTTPPPAPTGPVTLINETFDSATKMQQVLGGWTVTGGRYAIATVKSATVGNGNIAVYPVDISGDFTLTTDGLVSATPASFDDFSVLFGYKDTNNYYFASFNEANDNGTNGIFKVVNGSMTQLKDFTQLIKPGTNYKIKIVKSGTNYTVFSDTVNLGSVSDSAFVSGKVGYGSRNNAASFDNLLVIQ